MQNCSGAAIECDGNRKTKNEHKNKQCNQNQLSGLSATKRDLLQVKLTATKPLLTVDFVHRVISQKLRGILVYFLLLGEILYLAHSSAP